MHKIKTGVMIYQVRVQKKISRKELCAGLCSVKALANYENRERTPDGLLFHCFMQRMGMNPGDFSVIFSLEEYRYYMWKESVFEALQKQDWKTVECLYHDRMAEDRSCNVKIQNQFFLYLSSVLAERVEKDGRKALRLLKEAVKETVPERKGHGEYGIPGLGACRMSSFEIGLEALYYYKGGMHGILQDREVYYGLKTLLDYTDKIITDQQEQARLVPGMVCALLHTSRKLMTAGERLLLEEKAVRILKESYRLYHLPEILRFYSMDLRETGQKQADVYEKQYRAFVEAFEDAGFEAAFRPELLYDSRQQIYLLSEYMRSCREISGLTQEQISEGICAVETYSRLETGKRAPRRKEWEAIVDRLEIGWGFFKGNLETTDYQAFEYFHRFEEAARRDEWEKAQEFMDEVKRRLDMESISNRQYVGMMENCAAYVSHRIGEEEFFCRDKELLELSVKEERVGKTELYYFSHIEIVLHTHLANILRIQGRQEEGIRLLENMLNKLKKSRVGFEFWWEGLKLTIFNLANMLSDIGEYEASLKYMNDFIPVCFKLLDGKFVTNGICEKAVDLDKLGTINKATYKRLLIQASCLTDFYGLNDKHTIIEKYYIKHFCKNDNMSNESNPLAFPLI